MHNTAHTPFVKNVYILYKTIIGVIYAKYVQKYLILDFSYVNDNIFIKLSQVQRFQEKLILKYV